jgi:hypothetical protein
MDEHAKGGGIVNADAGVEPKDASVPVLLRVHHNPHHVIRGKRRYGANGTIIERQGVTLSAENVKLRTEKGAPVDARRRMRYTRVGRSRADRPHIEILAPVFEGQEGENPLGEPPHIFLAFIQFGRGIALTQKQQIHLNRGLAVFLDSEHAPGRRRP